MLQQSYNCPFQREMGARCTHFLRAPCCAAAVEHLGVCCGPNSGGSTLNAVHRCKKTFEGLR